MKIERNRKHEKWKKQRNMNRVQYGTGATWRECNTWKECKTKKVQNGKSETGKECNTENVLHEQSIVTEQNLEKSAKEECTIVHKRITGRPLSEGYTLVVAVAFSISARPLLLHFYKNIPVTLFLFLPRNIITSFQHGFRPFVDECFFLFFFRSKLP